MKRLTLVVLILMVFSFSFFCSKERKLSEKQKNELGAFYKKVCAENLFEPFELKYTGRIDTACIIKTPQTIATLKLMALSEHPEHYHPILVRDYLYLASVVISRIDTTSMREIDLERAKKVLYALYGAKKIYPHDPNIYWMEGKLAMSLMKASKNSSMPSNWERVALIAFKKQFIKGYEMRRINKIQLYDLYDQMSWIKEFKDKHSL